jgi:predicted nucleotidyltransferase
MNMLINHKLITDECQHCENIRAVYLLGSAAKGAMRPDSDIDLALMLTAENSASRSAFVDLGARLTLKLGHEVDIGIVSSANLVYARQAILTGKRLYARDRMLVEKREAELLGLYARFHEDRSEVLDAYRAR